MISTGGKHMLAQTADGAIRVMLVDSHRLVLSGLQRVIDDEKPDLAVVATATSCANAIELADRVTPDVVVLDSALAGENEAAVVPSLINGRNTRVLLLGSLGAGLTHEVAILRGACGVVRKEDTPEVLIKAIKKVHEGELWLDRSTTGRLFVELSRQKSQALADPAERKLHSLTSREQDVVRLLVTRPGADNKTLASNLHIGEHTLRNHLSRIYDKLDVPNRLELYVLAQRHGLNGRPRL
jgi:DNA-binding NarL/FixJ family response regulator